MACAGVVNSKDLPSPGTTQRTIFRNVVQMMYYHEQDGKLLLRERGLILRPKTIKAPAYQGEYDELVRYLGELLRE